MTEWLLLAQETITNAPAGGAPPAAPAPQSDLLTQFLLPMFLVIGVFYFIMWRGQKRDKQKFEDMLTSLARNDRVQTIGGIFGTVVENRGDEIVLKIDETNNVKIRIHRGAIKEIIQKSGAPVDAGATAKAT